MDKGAWHNGMQNNFEKFKVLFDSSHDAIIVLEDNKYIDCNKRTLELFKADNSYLLGKSPDEFSPEFQPNGSNSKEQIDKLLAKVSKGSPEVFDWQHKRPNGELFDVSISLSLVNIQDRNYYLAILRDIYDLKKTREALRKSEEKLEKVVYATTDGMWDWNLITNDVFYDPRYYELAGYEPNEFPHHVDEFFKRVHQDDLADLQRVTNEYLTGKSDAFYIEFRFLRKDNSYMWILGKGVIIERDSNGKPLTFTGTHTNIDLRRKLKEDLEIHKNNLELLVQERTYELEAVNEELTAINEELIIKNDLIGEQKNELEQTLTNLKETQSNLIQSEKMASLGLLTAGVAHEINNPLNFIHGGYDGLIDFCKKAGFVNNEELNLLLGSIKTGVERASEIVKGLNQFSRSRDSYDEQCDVIDIIDNCLLMLNNKTKRNITIEKYYSEKDHSITGNSGRLHQLFLNILLNAVQAIEGQGTIKIHTISLKNTIKTEITDTGCGISKENMSKIMDPFFTTKKVGEGTGLGLAISFSIIEEHNGRLEFSSDEGKGTTVKIILPKIKQ